MLGNDEIPMKRGSGKHNHQGGKSTSRYSHATRNGKFHEHVVVAERALGRRLPKGAQVHHVNHNPKDNRNQNLVICENQSYHALLHVRERIMRMGGDPNTEKICHICKKPVLRSNFQKDRCSYDGLKAGCKPCRRESQTQAYRLKKKAIAEASR